MAAKFFWQGYRAAIPLMVGVAPFGFVFGALAVAVGMSALQAFGMSVIVLAGSSQFVATELIGDHTPVALIVLTTFVINLRHFLYSASLADFFRPLKAGWKVLLGYCMVDEVYAVAILRKQTGMFSPGELRWYFLGAAFNLISVWWTTTIFGALIGDILPESTREVLGFTLPLIFTAIVVPTIVTRPLFLAAMSAGISGILLAPLPNRLSIIAAAIIGIAVGILTESLLGTPKEKSL